MQREPKEHKSNWSDIIRQGSRRVELVAFSKTRASKVAQQEINHKRFPVKDRWDRLKPAWCQRERC